MPNITVYRTWCASQRRDYSALVKFLPPKHEYVISVRLSSLQISLYQQYLDNFTSVSSLTSDGPGSKFQCAGLFSDYHSLMHIWTHPYVLRLDQIRQEKKVRLTSPRYCLHQVFVCVLRLFCDAVAGLCQHVTLELLCFQTDVKKVEFFLSSATVSFLVHWNSFDSVRRWSVI